MPNEPKAGEDEEPVLAFDHNVIEHLGIRLYQNKPGSVLAELVSNSWDADATEVRIEMSAPNTDASDRFVSVADNGVGMDLETIRTRYLIVGKPKRKGPRDRSPGGRSPMGRKGIGKLAPFGIARTVEVVTCAEGRVNWFKLDLDGLIAAGEHGRYPPDFVIRNGDLYGELPAEPPADIVAFIDRVRAATDGTGTLVRMQRFTANQDLTEADAIAALTAKFTVVLARSDFAVLIDGTRIDPASVLPTFEFRIPASGSTTESVGGRDVTYWVGFVGAASWPSDQAGVGVFAHGKSAQDRPFFFGAKGKEIYQRYLYGVVEADWLDELENDLISTDRSSLDWADPDASELMIWGRSKVGSWLDAYTDYRSSKHLGEVRRRASESRERGEVLRFSAAENDQIDHLVANATQQLSKDQDSIIDELTQAVSQAWLNLPSRRLLTDLWAGLEVSGGSAENFLALASQLREHSVPEAMGLAVTFAQRAYALSLLHGLVHRRSERNLQELIEEFPWILQPRGDLLTADQWLKTTVEHAALQDTSGNRAGRLIAGMSERERADFVFLTDSTKKTIQIVELKAPGHELTAENDRQLRDYLDFTQAFHSSASLTGLLVGNRGQPPIDSNDKRISVESWDGVLLECRAAYVQMLAAMLERADPDPRDARVKVAIEFGGEPVWDLLSQMASTDPHLADLMAKFAHFRGTAPT